MSAYLADRWHIPLVVVTAIESVRAASESPLRAQAYLETHGVQATFVQESTPAAELILETAEADQSDLIVMGGYGASPVVEVVLGSVVDQVLRESHKAVLICR